MDSTTYISIDVAVRSLAIGVYRMKPFKNIDAYKDGNVSKMNANLDSIIQPILMRVVDINDGEKTKDTSIANKAGRLKNTLCSIDDDIKDQIVNDISGGRVAVVVEYQLNANHGSNAIFNMILYHYANIYPIKVIKPCLKNTVSFHPKLTLSSMLAVSSTNYKANKDHTKYNMIYLLTAIDQLDMIKDIKSKNLDDIADTLLQCIAFHLRR